MKNTAFYLFILLFVFVSFISAQQTKDTNQLNIFETLAIPDSVTKATVKIHQDSRIESLVVAKKTGMGLRDTKTVSGFRVQVFSSNVQRTAKAEAFKREKQIKEEFPDQTVYVNYSSPFWKVRVGDFRTQAQAQEFRNEMISAFPSLRSETYIVKEQVFISASK